MWTLQVTFKKKIVINHAKNMRDRKNVYFLKQDLDPGSGSGYKILICRIQIRPKMDRIRNPAYRGTYIVGSCIVGTVIYF